MRDRTPDEEDAVRLVLDAMTDEVHASLCGCRVYPDACASQDDYRRDNLVHVLTYAEAALDAALALGWKPPDNG